MDVSGRRDIVDSLDHIFDGYDVKNKADEMKRRYNLSDQEYMELQSAYFIEKRGVVETGLHQMLDFLGIGPPKRRTPEEILENAKQRQFR